MLFDNVNRTDDSFKRNAETSFEFLNRSSRAEIARVRELVSVCFERYPDAEKSELISRLRSGDERHFRSGCFELLLHEYLIRQGFELEPHPELPNGSKTRPDFLVTCPDGARVYLEAASASEDNGENASAEAMKAVTLASLESATHPDFFVDISSSGDPKTQPSGGKLRDAVLKWLGTLKWEDVVTLPHDALPSLGWKHEDWHLIVRPIPVKEAARGKSRRLVGIGAGRAGWVNTWAPIRDSVIAKSRHYGDLALPLIVAVNVDTFALDPMDEMQALFGEEVVVFSSPTSQPHLRREPNGAWMGTDSVAKPPVAVGSCCTLQTRCPAGITSAYVRSLIRTATRKRFSRGVTSSSYGNGSGGTALRRGPAWKALQLFAGNCADGIGGSARSLSQSRPSAWRRRSPTSPLQLRWKGLQT